MTARAADDHELVITYDPIPATIEECGEALAHGEGRGRGWSNIFYWEGDFYDLSTSGGFIIDRTTYSANTLYCTKLKPVLREGTERD